MSTRREKFALSHAAPRIQRARTPGTPGRWSDMRRHLGRGKSIIVSFKEDEATQKVAEFKRSATKPVELAKQWIEAWCKDHKAMDTLLNLDCTLHPDDMWLPSPTIGLNAVKQQAKDFMQNVPDYKMDILEAASGVDADGGISNFFLWRGTESREEKAFTHLGLERHRRKCRSGKVTDMFVYSGPTRAQAEHLLLDPMTPFEEEAWEPVPRLSGLEISDTGDKLSEERKAAMNASAAILLGMLAGAPNIPDYDVLQQHMTHTIVFQEETRVWHSHNMHRIHGIAELVERVKAMTAWKRADQGFPIMLSKAYTDDGLNMFVHCENVFHDVRSGLRVISCRGPVTGSEKARYFNVLGCKQAGVNMSPSAVMEGPEDSSEGVDEEPVELEPVGDVPPVMDKPHGGDALQEITNLPPTDAPPMVGKSRKPHVRFVAYSSEE